MAVPRKQLGYFPVKENIQRQPRAPNNQGQKRKDVLVTWLFCIFTIQRQGFFEGYPTTMGEKNNSLQEDL